MASFVSASTAAARIVREAKSRRLLRSVFLIAIDGESGSGKSTVAELAAACMGAVLVPTDDFFAAEITDDGWNGRSAEERAADAICWRRVNTEVITPLKHGRAARWKAFDFAAGRRPDGTYGMQAEAKEQEPGEIVFIEGTYSTCPELADLYDLTVLLDVSLEERRTRLMEREGEAVLGAWRLRWDEAESHYFQVVRPPSSFDLVVKNG